MNKFKICVLISISTLFLQDLALADHCDEINTKAMELVNEAEKAKNQGDYQQAARFYDESAKNFDLLAGLTDCTNLKLPENGSLNAKTSRSTAESYRNYAQNLKVTESYNKAREIFLGGQRLVETKEYDRAIIEFEQAASIWEKIHQDFPNSKNGALAQEAASNARATIDELKQGQQKQRTRRRR
ncbi:MAG: hypothetical protein OEV64_10170 [Desulfobulbaceae bacterium]|nr:hypothetical protein [Desulfobulbaceae bacterium]